MRNYFDIFFFNIFEYNPTISKCIQINPYKKRIQDIN